MTKSPTEDRVHELIEEALRQYAEANSTRDAGEVLPPADDAIREAVTAELDRRAAAEPAKVDPEAVREVVRAEVAEKLSSLPAPAAPSIDHEALRLAVEEALDARHAEEANASKPADDDGMSAAEQAAIADAERDAEAERQDRIRSEEGAARARAEAATTAIAESLSAYAAAGKAPRATLASLKAGPVKLRLADGTSFIPTIAALAIDPAKLVVVNGQLLVDVEVAFDPAQPPAVVTEAWLIGDDGATIWCEVPSGLRIGGGLEALLPRQHLGFTLN